MKKILLIIVTILGTLFGITSYHAICEDNEILKRAEELNIKFVAELQDAPDIKYEPDSGPIEEVEPPKRPVVSLSIDNIPEDMYFIVVNNTLNTKETYKEFENGYLLEPTPDAIVLYNYTVKVYSSSAVCENELLRTETLNSLKFNYLNRSSKCEKILKDIESTGIEFHKCDMFVDKDYTLDEIETLDLEYEKLKEKKETKNNILDLFYKYYYFALIPIVGLGVYYIVRIAIIKRRKKKNEQE